MITNNHSKKALYEVIAKAKLNSTPDKPLQPPAQPVREVKPVEPKPVVVAEMPPEPKPEKPVRWPNKPRIAQLTAGRLEISVPVQAAIAVSLGLVLLILMVFRAGQLYSTTIKAQTPAAPAAKVAPKAVVNQAPQVQTPPVAVVTAVTKEEKPQPAPQKGDHIIVIAQSLKSRDLEPVQKFFAENGIETKIEPRGERFVLVTKNMYENPLRSGTDGHEIKAKIIKAGANYKAPTGYESFPKFFSDAYPEKVK